MSDGSQGNTFIEDYRSARLPVPESYERWHLYGAGLDNVGKDGRPESVPLPHPGPDEVLVRHDAVGICYSDIKIITLGENHPRLVGRNLQTDPVVMGHEVSLTIVAVGANQTDRFAPGQRFIVQADVYYHGVNLAYGYALSGGMSQYGLVGPEVLDGDEGCYLLPIKDDTGYAEAALVEPWACVEAAYHWKQPDGPVKGANRASYWGGRWQGESSWDGHLKDEGRTFSHLAFEETPDPDVFENAMEVLGKNGVVTLKSGLAHPVEIDIGRIHYDGHFYVGPKPNDRNELKGGGTAWFIGAAGPMGQMHVQRAFSLPNPPARLVTTDRNPVRIAALKEHCGPLARQRGVEMIHLNIKETPNPDLGALAPNGFDDIVVMVPDVAAIEDAFPRLAEDGVLNVFAGVARGTMGTLDIGLVATRNVRIVGTSGSTIHDMVTTRDLMERDQLDTGASLAAIGGLNAFRDGLAAVKNGVFPGKTVIFPQIKNLPLTALPDLKTVRPNVYAMLKDGHEWTTAAEEELLREELETS